MLKNCSIIFIEEKLKEEQKLKKEKRLKEERKKEK
jgi:hypothetical protein